MLPQKVIEIQRPEGGTVRIRIYPKGLVIERGTDTRAFILGVEVPEWLVEKSADEIDPRELFRIVSPRVRDRLVRKLGIRRVMSTLGGRVISRRGKERLIVFCDGGRRRVYFYTQSWSGQWWLEQVDPAIRTVSEAWEWKHRVEVEKNRQERAWRGLH